MITTDAISISKGLMGNQTLLKLFIGCNSIGDDGIAAIAGSLNSSHVTELYANACEITFDGVISLAAVLLTNKNIKTLSLECNSITNAGAYVIMKSAVDNGVCNVWIDDEYKKCDDVKKMMTILERQKVSS